MGLRFGCSLVLPGVLFVSFLLVFFVFVGRWVGCLIILIICLEMENLNIIFKNDNLEIFWQVGSTPMSGDAKGVKMKCEAINPNDGKKYEKYAGWIGLSLTLHGGVKTPGYINDAACDLIQKHKEEILPAIIDFLEANGKQYRAKEFREASVL